VASNWWLRHTVRARKNSRNRRCRHIGIVKLDNDLLVVDPMNSTVVTVIPRKFPKEQATQRGAPNGQTLDPASQGDEAETNKKN
jgi:hypothetical protein